MVCINEKKPAEAGFLVVETITAVLVLVLALLLQALLEHLEHLAPLALPGSQEHR